MNLFLKPNRAVMATFCALALASFAGCGKQGLPGTADSLYAANGEPDANASNVNKDTLQKIHTANQHEIDLADLADGKTKSDAVKNFAKMLKTSHEDADKKVTDLGDKLKLDLKDADDDAAVKKDFDALRSRLDALDGDAFDKAFVDQMIQDHEKVLADLKAAQAGAVSSDVKALVDELIPAVDNHLQAAKALKTPQGETPAQPSGNPSQPDVSSPQPSGNPAQPADVTAQPDKQKMQKQSKEPEAPPAQKQKEPASP